MTPIPEQTAALRLIKRALANPIPFTAPRATDPPAADSEEVRLMKIALGIASPSASSLAKRAPAAGADEYTELSCDGRVERTYYGDGTLKKIRLVEDDGR